MGNSDNWTTPKQIKIEREGEPRGTKRGRLKKGERRKGVKARMDEVKSAYKTWQLYKKWYDESMVRGNAFGFFGAEWQKENMEKAFSRYSKLREAYIKDHGAIDDN